MTEKQLEMLKTLGFSNPHEDEFWEKNYRKHGYIVVLDSQAFHDKITSCKEAQSDLMKLQGVGIV